MRRGLSVEEIHTTTHWDIWFLEQIAGIVAAETYVAGHGLPTDKAALHRLKSMGFSDARLAKLSGKSQDEVADIRTGMGITPVYKRIDTCAAEFASETAYLYSSFEDKAGAVCEAALSEREKIVHSGGPNRIGQGIEFDYCCVHAAYALSEAGYETIMINCNPETVSTDYDTSDRLYFEPLTQEDVISVIRTNRKAELKGVVVQLGGQTLLKIAASIEAAGIPILWTSPDAIDLAEDRERFQQLIHKLGLKQPENGIAHSVEDEARRSQNRLACQW